MLCLFLPLFCSRFSAIKWNRSPFDTCSLQLLRSFPSDFSVCNDRLVPPDLFHPSRYNTIHQTQLFLPATSSNLFSSSFLSSFCLATQSVNNCFLYPDRQTSFPRFFPFSLIQDFDRVCSIIISYHLTDSLYFCFFFLLLVDLSWNRESLDFQLIYTVSICFMKFVDCPRLDFSRSSSSTTKTHAPLDI